MKVMKELIIVLIYNISKKKLVNQMVINLPKFIQNHQLKVYYQRIKYKNYNKIKLNKTNH